MSKARPVNYPNSGFQINRQGLVVCDSYINILGARAIRFYGSNSTHLIHIDPFQSGLRTSVLISADDCQRWSEDFKSLRRIDIDRGIEERTEETRISATTAVMCWLTGTINVDHFKNAIECLYTPEPGATLIRSFKIKYGVDSRIVHILPDDQLIYHMATYNKDGKIIE